MRSGDAYYMGLAMAEARQAAAEGEVPVGAVIVRRGLAGGADRILASAHNRPIGLNDPTAHAEMLALRAAAMALGNYRLDDCELFVTLEPCAMCAQAMLHARIARVVYGAREPKTGAAGSVIDVFGHPLLNHHTAVEGGLEAEGCAALMRSFFGGQRKEAKRRAVPLRDDALRTPDGAFERLWQSLPEWRCQSRWTREGTALQGLRLHWMELSPGDAPAARPSDIVLLHGPAGWWPEWGGFARMAQAHGHRVLLPDLVGFGMSDKPKKPRWHTLKRHADVLADWLESIGATAERLVVTPEQAPLAHALRRRLGLDKLGVDIRPSEPLPNLPIGWQDLPFPDAGHRAAQKAWPWPEG